AHPRVARGIRQEQLVHLEDRGLTPAWRGEFEPWASAMLAAGGSPPRGAGNSSRTSSPQLPVWAHPRVARGIPALTAARAPLRGLTPAWRGEFGTRLPLQRFQSGSPPRGAGNSCLSWPRARRCGAHPRVARGIHSVSPHGVLPTGLTPAWRGEFNAVRDYIKERAGSPPRGAGNSRPSAARWACRRAHPRVARGIPAEELEQPARRRLTPAWRGEFHRRFGCRPCQSGSPPRGAGNSLTG
ncbi:Hypothetical protein PROPAUS_2058, partial [Propionibacterium australiense]